MPYNLRKRKAVEPVEEPRKKTKAKAANTVEEPPRKTKAKVAEPVEEPQKKTKAKTVEPVEEPPKKTKAKAAEPVTKGRKKVEAEAVEPVEEPPTKTKAKAAEPLTKGRKRTKAETVEPVEHLNKEAETAEPTEELPEEIKEKTAELVDELKTEPEPEDPLIDEPKKKAKVGFAKPVEPTECNLYVLGDDICGELGMKKIGISKKKPTLVPLGCKIKQVACGPMHTITLTTTGQVYSFGCNDEGALGRATEDEEEEATPTLVPLDCKITKVTAGDSHSAALSEGNKVLIWGNFKDDHGSIGLLPECNGEKTSKPIQLMPEIDFQDIASGSNHMLLLDTNGRVYSFGVGAQGQLGRLKPEQIGTDEKEAFPITAENRDLFLRPQLVDLKNVDPQRPFICDAIYAGNYSSFATNTDKKKNRLAAWGLNNYHQLGLRGLKNSMIQHQPKRATFTCSTSMINVACGEHHTLFLTRTGRVYAAGKPLYGLLGIGTVSSETVCPAKQVDKLSNSVVNIAVNASSSFAVSDDGKLYSWGASGPSLGVDSESDLMYPTEVAGLDGKKVISVSSGSSFTALLAE